MSLNSIFFGFFSQEHLNQQVYSLFYNFSIYLPSWKAWPHFFFYIVVVIMVKRTHAFYGNVVLKQLPTLFCESDLESYQFSILISEIHMLDVSVIKIYSAIVSSKSALQLEKTWLGFLASYKGKNNNFIMCSLIYKEINSR